MPTEIVVETADEPGMLAGVGELFGERGVNITAGAAFTHGGRGFLHFVVDDADQGVGILKEAGYEIIQVREVLLVSLDDRPGELGRFARRLSDAGVNITSFYTGGGRAGDKELIIAVDDVETVREQL